MIQFEIGKTYGGYKVVKRCDTHLALERNRDGVPVIAHLHTAPPGYEVFHIGPDLSRTISSTKCDL